MAACYTTTIADTAALLALLEGFRHLAWTLAEFPDRLEVTAAAQTSWEGLPLGGRLFDETAELHFEAEGEGYRLRYITESAQPPPGEGWDGPADLPQAQSRTFFLWGEPSKQDGAAPGDWDQQRVGRVLLPLRWTEQTRQTARPVADISIYQRRPEDPLLWRFRTLRVATEMGGSH